jgi:hypothetical protein
MGCSSANLCKPGLVAFNIEPNVFIRLFLISMGNTT